jgi:hypothetical protein
MMPAYPITNSNAIARSCSETSHIELPTFRTEDIFANAYTTLL